MTFFANSGIAFPKLELATSEVGKQSLKAASDLFGVLADIEGSSEGGARVNESERLKKTASAFRSAAKRYRNIALETDAQPVKWLSSSELDFASIERQVYEYYYTEPYLFKRYVTINFLYEELARRLDFIADRIDSIIPLEAKIAMAPSVFALMAEWNKASVLARVIAVVNRRREAK